MKPVPLCDEYQQYLALYSSHACTRVCVCRRCMWVYKAELLIIYPGYKMLMHILPAIHKHEGSFCMYLVGGDYTWWLYVCAPVCNFSSCWNEKCLHVYGRVCLWERSLAHLSLQTVVWHSSVMKPLCPPFVFLFPSFSSSFLLSLAAVLLRSRSRLALINVPGIRLALRLSFPLPSLLQLHHAFYPCHPRMRNTSWLQLQLVPVPSSIHTHTL